MKVLPTTLACLGRRSTGARGIALPAVVLLLPWACATGGGPGAKPTGDAVATATASSSQSAQLSSTPSIQVDTKGVEFGPWLRAFVAQVRRNWFVPESAMTAKGRVVVTFRVRKNGSITSLAIQEPSPIDVFNKSAYDAVAHSDPVAPLPSGYLDEYAMFTVTFYYNESSRDR